IRLHFDAMRQTFRYVPSGFDADCTRRACGDAGARGATGTWIEAECVARRIEVFIEQQCGAKRDPRSIQWMHRDAEDAGAGDTRDFAELDEAERAAVAHERVDGGASQARCAQWGGE